MQRLVSYILLLTIAAQALPLRQQRVLAGPKRSDEPPIHLSVHFQRATILPPAIFARYLAQLRDTLTEHQLKFRNDPERSYSEHRAMMQAIEDAIREKQQNDPEAVPSDYDVEVALKTLRDLGYLNSEQGNSRPANKITPEVAVAPAPFRTAAHLTTDGTHELYTATRAIITLAAYSADRFLVPEAPNEFVLLPSGVEDSEATITKTNERLAELWVTYAHIHYAHFDPDRETRQRAENKWNSVRRLILSVIVVAPELFGHSTIVRMNILTMLIYNLSHLACLFLIDFWLRDDGPRMSTFRHTLQRVLPTEKWKQALNDAAPHPDDRALLARGAKHILVDDNTVTTQIATALVSERRKRIAANLVNARRARYHAQLTAAAEAIKRAHDGQANTLPAIALGSLDAALHNMIRRAADCSDLLSPSDAAGGVRIDAFSNTQAKAAPDAVNSNTGSAAVRAARQGE